MSTTESTIAARPLLGRSPAAPFETIEIRRSALQAGFNAELARRGIDGLVIQSSPYAHECWVKAECWMPAGDSQETARRASVTATFQAKQFRRFPVEIRLDLRRDGKHLQIASVIEIQADQVSLLVDFLAGVKRKIRKGQFKRCRPERPSFTERFSLPANRVTGLKYRWISHVRVYWAAYFVLAAVGVIAGVGAQLPVLSAAGGLFALFLVILRLSIPVIYQRRGQRPTQEPRLLRRFDSWQTVVSGLGIAAAELREAVLGDLRHGSHPGVAIEVEKVWHWGLDEKVEREQIVVRFRRAMVFIEIHAYGEDLYVDWDAFLNWGVWREKRLGVGYEDPGKRIVTVHGIEAGWQVFGEYDLSDMNFALEWVHAVIRRHMKRLMAERKIDEEVDFKIIREERGEVTTSKPEGKEKGARGRLRRIG